MGRHPWATGQQRYHQDTSTACRYLAHEASAVSEHPGTARNFLQKIETKAPIKRLSQKKPANWCGFELKLRGLRRCCLHLQLCAKLEEVIQAAQGILQLPHF